MKTNAIEACTKTNPHWKTLFKVGGAAALIAAVLLLAEVSIESIGGIGLTTAPKTAIEWFTLLQNNSLLGLAVQGIFEVIGFSLTTITFLALYGGLKKISESFMAIALTLYIISTTVYLASNTAFSMLSLSNQYATATTETQKSTLLAAGQAVIALNQGTGNSMVFVLGSLAGIIVSIIMLRSKVFSKPIAILGIAANALGLLGSYAGLIVWSLNGLLMLVWIVAVGLRLLKLAQTNQIHPMAVKYDETNRYLRNKKR